MTITTEQILALAPDAAAAKAGSQLSSATKWSGLGSSDQALWGLCQGSGKDPYKAQIDLSEPAFKCSCPSRKFPCKHGLGLYLLYAQQQALFAPAAAPDWVIAWLDSRQQRAEKVAAKKEAVAEQLDALSPEERAKKEKSQLKRQEKRLYLVDGGVEIIERWLSDIAREGVATLKSKSLKEWDALAARMVDSQASGLATRIKKIGAMLHQSSKANWEMQIAEELALLAMLVHSYRAIDTLPVPLQADIRSAIGWSLSQDQVGSGEGVSDLWQVIGARTQVEEKLTVRANYIQGLHTGRIGMLLQFGAGNQPLPPPLVIGSHRVGEVYFYPSATPLRVIFSAELQACEAPIASTLPQTGSARDIPALLDRYADLLAQNPLIDEYPFLLEEVTLLSAAGKWLVCPRDGSAALRVAGNFSNPWKLMSLAGGEAISLFGLWDGERYLPLSATVNGVVYSLEEPRA